MQILQGIGFRTNSPKMLGKSRKQNTKQVDKAITIGMENEFVKKTSLQSVELNPALSAMGD